LDSDLSENTYLNTISQERRKFDKEFKLMSEELSKSRDNLKELAR